MVGQMKCAAMKTAAFRIVVLGAAALLLTACSMMGLAYNNIRVLYSNAAPMLTWMVDDYVDVSGSQKDWVRERFERAMAWHRQSELPEYRRYLDTVVQRFDGNFTPGEVRQSFVEMQAHWHRAVEHLLPDIADFLLQLDGEQVTQLERKFADDNRKVVKESTRGDPEDRLRERVKKTVAHFEEWVGRLDDSQRELIERTLRGSVDLTQERLLDRKARQRQTLALIRSRPGHQQMVAGLRRLLIDIDSWRRPEYQEKLRERDARTFAMISQLSATLSPQQRAHFVKRVRGFNRDISLLTASI